MVETERALVAIVGLGTIGRQELDLWKGAGVDVVGYDTSEASVARLRANLPQGPRTGALLTDDSAALRDRNVLVLCLPTAGLSGDTTSLAAFDQFAVTMRAIAFVDDPLVIIASTVPVGFCRAYATQLGRSSVAHAPERFDPGRQLGLQQIPRVVGGIDDRARRKAAELYGRLGVRALEVSSLEVAEASKILENAFRLVNISFINEFAALCEPLGLSAAEVIEAAATKPFGFMAHYPGSGAGGTCIPVVPRFFAQTAAKHGITMPILSAAITTNDQLAERVTDRLSSLIGPAGRVIVVGATYKPDYPDSRGSAAVRLIRRISQHHSTAVLDPYINESELPEGATLHREPPSDHFDAAVVAVRHRAMEGLRLDSLSSIVIDLTRGETTFAGSHERQRSPANKP